MLNSDVKNNTPIFFPWGIFLFCLLIAVDQVSKYFASNIFRNAFFAFSLPLPVWLMYFIYLCVIGGIIYYLLNNYGSLTFFAKVAWVFIFAGAMANIGERIVLGYVRDWVYIYNGVFNLADFYIILGIIFLLLPPSKNKQI